MDAFAAFLNANPESELSKVSKRLQKENAIEYAGWTKVGGIKCRPLIKHPSELAKKNESLIGRCNEPTRTPSAVVSGITIWAPKSFTGPITMDTKLSSNFIFRREGQCFFNISWVDAADLFSRKLHEAARSEWQPIAGAGAITRARVTKNQRIQAFINKVYAAPAAPPQMPRLTICETTEEQSDDTCLIARGQCASCGLLPSEGRWLQCGGQGCKARYCGRDHQAQAWRHDGHRATCGEKLPTAEAVLRASTDLLARLLQQYGVASVQLTRACLSRCHELSAPELESFVSQRGLDFASRAVAAHQRDEEVAIMGAQLLGLAGPTKLCMDMLSDEVLLAVLCRVPRISHESLPCVSQRWRVMVRNEEYVCARRCCPLTGKSSMESLILTVGGAFDGDSKEELLRTSGVGDRSGLASPMLHGRASMLMDCKHWVPVEPAPLPAAHGHVLVAVRCDHPSAHPHIPPTCIKWMTTVCAPTARRGDLSPRWHPWFR